MELWGLERAGGFSLIPVPEQIPLQKAPVKQNSSGTSRAAAGLGGHRPGVARRGPVYFPFPCTAGAAPAETAGMGGRSLLVKLAPGH
ncbi:unnamed protein product [Caretta caretta]